MPRQALPASIIACYGLPGLAAALPVIPVAVLLPAWYARDLGLGFVVTGVVLALARLFDFITDPLVGVLSDRFAIGGLHYKPWVLGGALVAGAGLALLATPPEPATPLALGCGALLLFGGWTAFMIPYTAWGADLAADPHQRSLVAASREVAGLLGMLVALSLPALAEALLGTAAPPPMTLLALAAAVFGLPAIGLLLARVPEPARLHGTARVSVRDLRELLRFAPCRRTLSGWFLNGIANGLPAVLFPVVVSDFFARDDAALYLLLVCYFGAAVCAAPLWLHLARRIGKASAWRTAIAFNMLVFAQVLWLSPSDFAWFVAVCLLSGATLGADLALPASIQADVMALDRERVGRSRTASAFALWSMATKLALALAVAVAFVGVGAGGGDGDAPVAPLRLMACYVALPLLFKAAVWWLLRVPPASVDAQAPAQETQHPTEQRQSFV